MLNFKKLSGPFLLIAASYFLLALFYIHPGEIPLLEFSKTSVLSDGTDPATFPYQFAFLKNTALSRPGDLFFGAVYNAQMDYPYGVPLWIPPVERIIGVVLSLVLPIEQVSTGFVVIYLILDAISMYLLGRALNISREVSWGMGLAWAFNAYTRARARVHMGLVGIYHLPLVFLALVLLSRSKKFSFRAIFLFLLVVSCPHYYVVTLAFFSPLLLAFYWIWKNEEKPSTFGLKLLLSALPAILLLLYSLLVPVPSAVKNKTSLFPTTGEYRDKHHPFLDRFSVGFDDYLTGDIGLGNHDLNPIKETLNLELLHRKYDGSFAHEKAVGIRWLLLILAFFSVIHLLPSKKNFWSGPDRKLVIVFAVFGFFAFWMSLPPAWPFHWGPSYWVHKLVPQIRVPSRASIGVSFAVILLSGLFLKNLFLNGKFSARRQKMAGFLFSIVLLLELPPFYQNMPISQVRPTYKQLVEVPQCGLGMQYPFVTGYNVIIDYYYMLQKMRGSNCLILNSSTPHPHDQLLLNAFSFQTFHQKFQANAHEELNKLKKFIDCVPLAWITLGPPLESSPESSKEICDYLGLRWEGDGSCIRENLSISPSRSIESCLN